MRILGIESSCDETAAAVVEDGEFVLSSVVASQLGTHGKYGGVVPELASREHLRAIVPAVRLALEQSKSSWSDLAAIAVTEGPGLVGSLLVGITYAKSLCFARGIPLIGVNHIEGHIHAVVLEAKRAGSPVELPALALVVSGGHTHLFEVSENFQYRLLGKTRDDAAGEAFDKVAKLLGFGYPGGPVIDRLAPYGNPRAVPFTLAKMKGNTLDFSFSGIKTAVLRWTQARDMDAEIERRRELLRSGAQPTDEQWLAVTPKQTLDLLASFQATVIEELLRRAARSAEEIGARSLIISGGVACNSGLRAAARSARLGIPVRFPSPGLSTDNAAMIAAAAFPKYERGEFADFLAARVRSGDGAKGYTSAAKRLANGGKRGAALTQNHCREAFLFAQQPEQQMVGADVLVIEPFGFLGAIGEYACALLTQRHIHRRRYVFANRGASLDLPPNGIHSSVRPEESIRQRFIFPQKTQQQVFGFDVRTAKLAGLVPSEKDYPTCLLGITFKHRPCRFRYWLTRLSPILAGPSPWKAPTEDASLTV